MRSGSYHSGGRGVCLFLIGYFSFHLMFGVRGERFRSLDRSEMILFATIYDTESNRPQWTTFPSFEPDSFPLQLSHTCIHLMSIKSRFYILQFDLIKIKTSTYISERFQSSPTNHLAILLNKLLATGNDEFIC